MLTRKQQQGIKILESIVQSEYPFVVSLRVSDEPLDKYPTMLNVILEIDPITLSTLYDLPFDKKFKSDMTWEYYSGKESSLGYLVHLFPDEYHEEFGWRYNNKIEAFMTQAYTQLPSTMRVNSYNTTPEDQIPDWALRYKSGHPRKITIDKFRIVDDSKRPTRFKD